MTRRSMLGALLALAVVGCRRASVVEDADPVDVALNEPWADMGLPVGEGRVLFSNIRMVTVAYPVGTVDSLAAIWRRYLLDRGWTQRSDVSGADMRSYGFEREGATMALGVYPGIDGVIVTLTLFSPGGDGERAGEPQ